MSDHQSMMQVQWVMRILDFFAASMVIPTMAQFLVALGGTSQDYYKAIVATTVLQVVGNLVVGILVDYTGKIRATYIPLCACSIIGSGLYAACDAIEAFRRPWVLIVSRMITGVGTARMTLTLITLARAVPDTAERNKWLVAMSTARSMGLFVGPGVAVVLTWLAGGVDSDAGGSLFGAFALPGLFLCVMNILSTVWLLVVFQDPPAPEEPKAGLKKRLSSPMSSIVSLRSNGASMTLCQFLRTGYVLAVVLMFVFVIGCAAAIEYVVPIMCTSVLQWSTAGSGAVLMGISVSVLTSQILIMLLQRVETPRIKKHLTDINFSIVGTAGLAFTLGVYALVWAITIGRGPGAPAAARANSALLVVPFILAEVWVPYIGNGGNMLFTRLVLSHVPLNMGICQALVNTNGPVVGQTILTMWMGATYSGSWIQDEGAPQTAISGMAVLCGLILIALLFSYSSLRPGRLDDMPSSAAADRFCPALSEYSECVSRQQSLCFGDMSLPVEEAEMEHAEELLEAGSPLSLDRPLLSS